MKYKDTFKSLSARILFWFLIIALMPLMISLVVTYSQRQAAIEAQTFNKLIAIRDLKVKQVQSWLDEREGDLGTITQESEFADLELGINQNPNPQMSYGKLSSVRQVLMNYLENYSAYNEIFILHPRTGKILLSTKTYREGVDRSKALYFIDALESGELVTGDITYSESLGGPTMIYSVPIFCTAHDGLHITAILAARIDLQRSLYPLLLDRVGLGETGETLIINHDIVALNELRWYEHAPLNLQIHAKPAELAAHGKTGITTTDDYRGEPVLAAYTHIGHVDWGFVCKQDLYELNRPIREMLANFLAIFFISTVVVIIAATFLAKSLSKPIVQMADLSTEITAGDFSKRMETDSADEIGDLSRAINNMAESIQNRVVVQNGVLNLADTIISPGSIKEFCSELLVELMEVTGANMSAFYILDESTSKYEHFSSIGGNPGMMRPFSSTHPEGEFGLAISQKKIIHINDIPQDTRFIFKTTAGEIIPNDIITIPIIVEHLPVALVSLAYIHKFSKTSFDILEQTWLSINISYSNLLANQRTQVLAENLSKINQELAAQAEELQQQTEELEASSFQLQEQNVELNAQRKNVEEANRLKSEFLSNMSHELRTPLNSVLALSNVLLDDTRDRLTEEETNYLEIILRNARQLLKLINDILDLSKIEAGQMDVVLTSFSPASTVNDIVESMTPLAGEKENSLSIKISEDVGEITSDQQLVHGIIQNLVANAVKFTQAGTITVAVEQENGEFTISVTDTGIGISESALPYIFDEFRQGDGSTSREYEGTGLGLTISNKYAQVLGGELTAQSELGKGSVFTLRLPSKIEKIENPPANQNPVAPGRISRKKILGKDQIRLLIVEDQEPAIIQLRSILEPLGYTIDVANNGEDALEYLTQQLPDGIILDLMLPGVDGFEVLRRVRQSDASVHVPILILSSKSLTGDERRMLLHNNIQELIRKGDVNKTVLIEKIGTMLNLESADSGAPKSEPSAKQEKADPDPKKQATILIMEDNLDSLTALRAVLKDRYNIIEAMDGEKGWELFQKKTPDLVLLDMMLPKVDGYEIARRAKADEQLKSIPIIGISGKALREQQEEILAAGCDESLSKPFEVEVLRTKISDWLSD